MSNYSTDRTHVLQCAASVSSCVDDEIRVCVLTGCMHVCVHAPIGLCMCISILCMHVFGACVCVRICVCAYHFINLCTSMSLFMYMCTHDVRICISRMQDL